MCYAECSLHYMGGGGDVKESKRGLLKLTLLHLFRHDDLLYIECHFTIGRGCKREQAGSAETHAVAHILS